MQVRYLIAYQFSQMWINFRHFSFLNRFYYSNLLDCATWAVRNLGSEWCPVVNCFTAFEFHLFNTVNCIFKHCLPDIIVTCFGLDKFFDFFYFISDSLFSELAIFSQCLTGDNLFVNLFDLSFQISIPKFQVQNWRPWLLDHLGNAIRSFHRRGKLRFVYGLFLAII